MYGLRNSTRRKELGGVKLTGKKRYKMTANRERERERGREGEGERERERGVKEKLCSILIVVEWRENKRKSEKKQS